MRRSSDGLSLDLPRLFVLPQSRVGRMPQMPVRGPLGELDLRDEPWLSHRQLFICRESPHGAPLFWQVDERTFPSLQAGEALENLPANVGHEPSADLGDELQ